MEIQNEVDLKRDRKSSKFFQTRLSQIQAEISAFQELRSDLPDLPVCVELPAVDAVGWTNGFRSVDIHPRLLDKSSNETRLIDRGAQLSAAKRGPDDLIDNSVRLIAVNGSKIQTYGTKEIKLKIGRKQYSIQAVICDIKEDILGMDFMDKYRLGLEWDDYDQSELSIVDKKAQIKSVVKIITVPCDLQRAHHLEAAYTNQTGPKAEGWRLHQPILAHSQGVNKIRIMYLRKRPWRP